ncbi:MAG: hydrogenase iron-sulfur subunit [Promethearchaeota archaeon]
MINNAKQSEFKPQILAFCCNWCSYAGADLAGVSRYQYPPYVRVIRVMCSGRVEPTFILKAFLEGIDGVLVTGCHIGDCHYITGNHYTQIRMDHLKHLLKKIGIEEERFRLHWISASEGKQFAELITDFTETIERLGPSKIPKKKRLTQLIYC